MTVHTSRLFDGREHGVLRLAQLYLSAGSPRGASVASFVRWLRDDGYQAIDTVSAQRYLRGTGLLTASGKSFADASARPEAGRPVHNAEESLGMGPLL